MRHRNDVSRSTGPFYAAFRPSLASRRAPACRTLDANWTGPQQLAFQPLLSPSPLSVSLVACPHDPFPARSASPSEVLLFSGAVAPKGAIKPARRSLAQCEACQSSQRSCHRQSHLFASSAGLTAPRAAAAGPLPSPAAAPASPIAVCFCLRMQKLSARIIHGRLRYPSTGVHVLPSTAFSTRAGAGGPVTGYHGPS